MGDGVAEVAAPVIRRGRVHVLIAYDVGLSIDLSRARQHITDLTELARIQHKAFAPAYFQVDPPPLRVTQEFTPLSVAGRTTTPTLDVVIYDFGGVSVGYTIPFSGTFEELVELSCALSGEQAFAEDSRQRIEHLMAVIESAVHCANVAELYEDYIVFQVEETEPKLRTEDLHTVHAQQIARLLRSERDELSEQELADAMSNRVSFGAHDVALIDWNAALLFDQEPQDVRFVLEFANLQLLEMRFLDQRLDTALDRSYEVMSQPKSWRELRMPGRARAEMRKLARMQVDGAILFERVSNALKLLGDQYLARVYRAASQRYRLAEWNANILRKLETTGDIYQKLHDQSLGLRMEVLEWVIILLIAFEIVLTLVERIAG